MRMFNSERSNECGPVAIYNMARLLRLPNTKGGYAAHRNRLRTLVGHDTKTGTSIDRMQKVIKSELRGSTFKVVERRNSWVNVWNQLYKASAPAVCIVAWFTKDDFPHAAALWKPYGREGVVLSANISYEHPVVPLWFNEGGKSWISALHPQGRVLGFWQVCLK